MENEVRIPINSDRDVVTARQKCRGMASELGFASTDVTLIATAISELARNIVEHAGHGEIVLNLLRLREKTGICIVARDDGPGIADIAQVMRDGYSSRKSLGLGLPGTRRIVDEFDIISQVGRGTTVTIKKWHHNGV